LYDSHNYDWIGGFEAEIVRTVIVLHKVLNMKNTGMIRETIAEEIVVEFMNIRGNVNKEVIKDAGDFLFIPSEVIVLDQVNII